MVTPTFNNKVKEYSKQIFSDFISHLDTLKKDSLTLQKEFSFREIVMFDLYDDDIDDVLYDIMGIAPMGQVPMGLAP